jgi:hypothetical protein
MAEPERPRSPFAGMADLSARSPVPVLSSDEIERMLAQHRLYPETEYHQGHRANFASADLTGRDFSGLLDRADLAGAFLNGAQFLNCAQLIVTRNWQSAFRDDTLACGADVPDRKPSE